MCNQLTDNAFIAKSLWESRLTGNLYIRFDEGEGGNPSLLYSSLCNSKITLKFLE